MFKFLSPLAGAMAVYALSFASIAASPTQTLNAKQIAFGGLRSCAVTVSGGVKCWGGFKPENFFGATYDPHRRAVDVPGLTSGVVAVSVGEFHACALSTGGGVKCWGSNNFGQLGDGTNINRETPVDVVGLSSGVAAIAAGDNNSCALMTGGGVKCWGYNFFRQLGDGTNIDRNTPVNVLGLPAGLKSIAMGSQVCAITASNGVVCWGDDRTAPASIPGLTSVTALSVGGGHTCAIASSALKCWGSNVSGQLGLGSFTPDFTGTPTQVLGLASGVVGVMAANSHTCAIVTGGGVKCWGKNALGELGIGSFDSTRTEPADVIGLGAGVVALAGSARNTFTNLSTGNTCALMSDGGVKCWGANFSGQVGDGTYTIKYTPVDVRAQLPISYDFSGEGNSDIVLQDGPSGDTSIAYMSGTTLLERSPLLYSSFAESVSHVADFNGDSYADILTKRADGTVSMRLSNGTPYSYGVPDYGNTLPVFYSVTLLGAGTGWSVSHVADFNGDGKTDILLKHTDGSVAVWLMDGFSLISGAGILGAGSGWSVSHTADLNGDGKADLLFQHTDGRVMAWIMNGTSVVSGAFLIGAGTGWSVSHTADLNGDGKADILWRLTDGSAAVWLMNGTTLLSGGGIVGAGAWSVTHVADFNGDGKSDILLKNVDGTLLVWLMNGTTVTAGSVLLGAATGWNVATIGDYNGDAKSDIVLRRTDGTIVVWLMNGMTVANGAPIVGTGVTRVIP